MTAAYGCHSWNHYFKEYRLMGKQKPQKSINSNAINGFGDNGGKSMFLGGTNTKFSKISAKEFASFFHTLIFDDSWIYFRVGLFWQTDGDRATASFNGLPHRPKSWFFPFARPWDFCSRN